MSKLLNLTSSTKNLFNQARSLNSEDFEKFLFNLELVKKDTIQSLRRKKSQNFFEHLESKNVPESEKGNKFFEYLNS